MLTKEQIQFFKTFGFLVRKNVFSPDEMGKFRKEIHQRTEEAARLVPFEPTKIGQGGRQFNMLSASTPFTTSLLEDDRLAGAAEQLFDEIAWACMSGHQFVGDSVWHYDGGCFESPGVNNILYTKPVRANSGALRVIPGSHERAVHDQIKAFDPLGPKWTRAAATPEQKRQALEEIGTIPCYVCEADPGDVVSFELRIFHGSLGGGGDRRGSTITYHALPQIPEEIELSILNCRGTMTPSDRSETPWNPPRDYPDEWLANPQNNPRRAAWIERINEFSQMEPEQHGVRAIVENGKWKMVPCEEGD